MNECVTENIQTEPLKFKFHLHNTHNNSYVQKAN